MLSKLLLIIIPLLSTALLGTAAAAIERRANTTVPTRDWVLFDIKANSHPPKYLKCTRDNIGDRFCGENRHSIYTCAIDADSEKPKWLYDEATGDDGNGCATKCCRQWDTDGCTVDPVTFNGQSYCGVLLKQSKLAP